MALAAWSTILIVTGILITARVGTPTYYEEMVFAHRALPVFQHAISHAVAFVFVAVVGLLLGWPVYWVAKRGRTNRAASQSELKLGFKTLILYARFEFPGNDDRP